MKRGSYLSGVLAMTASAVFFSATAAVLRASPTLDFFVVSLYRFIVGGALLGLLAIGGKIRLEFRNTPVLLLRGLFGGAAVVTFYMSIQKLGIIRGTAINYTYPVFATLGGVLFLKHRVRPLVWPLLAVAAAGMALLVGVLGGPEAAGPGSAQRTWTILAVVGAVASGAAIVCVKRLTASEPSASIYLSQCVVGFWMVVIPANLVPGTPGLGPALLLVLLGLLATGAQLLMTWSYGHLPIATGSLLSLLTPLLNLLSGMVLFGEKLRPAELAGTALIIGACIAVALLERTALAPQE